MPTSGIFMITASICEGKTFTPFIELQSPTDGHVIRATAPLPPELESVLGVLRAQHDGLPGLAPGLGSEPENPVQERDR